MCLAWKAKLVLLLAQQKKITTSFQYYKQVSILHNSIIQVILVRNYENRLKKQMNHMV